MVLPLLFGISLYANLRERVEIHIYSTRHLCVMRYNGQLSVPSLVLFRFWWSNWSCNIIVPKIVSICANLQWRHVPSSLFFFILFSFWSFSCSYYQTKSFCCSLLFCSPKFYQYEIERTKIQRQDEENLRTDRYKNYKAEPFVALLLVSVKAEI